MVFFEKYAVEEANFFHHFTLSNYHFPLHFHRAYEFIIVLEGKLEVTIDQMNYTVEAGNLIFIFANQMHAFKTIEQSEIAVVQFSPELIADFHLQYQSFIPQNNVLSFTSTPVYNLDHIYKQKSFLYDWCAQLIAQKSFIPIERSTHAKILYCILLYIEQNFANVCTLKGASEYLRYDYSYVSKLFVKRMNMTFTQYLNHYRISHACYLLKNSPCSIDEIAIKCGYNNLRSFHYNFKKITRQSPTHYRLF